MPITAALEARYWKAYGHGFFKVLDNGDEERAVFPERDTLCGNGMYLYHRYKKMARASRDMHGLDPTKDYVYMSFCSCNHSGGLCCDCASLNTTDYLGLRVPLCPEDFREMRRMLLTSGMGWNETRLVAWLDFWITVLAERYAGWSAQRLVFFDYEKFGVFSRYRSAHGFFRYLYRFVMDRQWQDASCDIRRKTCRIHKGGVLSRRASPLIRTVSDGVVDIRGGDATIRWTLLWYAAGRQIGSIHTDWTKRRVWTRLLLEPLQEDAVIEKMRTPARAAFARCLAAIREEVAYRPGMMGMQEAEADFARLCGDVARRRG